MQKGVGHTIVSTTSTPSVARATRRIPLWLKLTYTAFMAVLVPVYLRNYGPTNFLYFCDVALIITLIGIWIESPLLVSMCAVGIIASQTLWVIDFLSNLIGHPLTGLTDYMFMADHSLFLRGLSLFHGCGLAMTGAPCRLGPWLPGRWCSSPSSSCRRLDPIRA